MPLGFQETLLPGIRVDDEPLLTLYKCAIGLLLLSSVLFPVLMLWHICTTKGSAFTKVFLQFLSLALSLYQLIALAQPVS